MKNLKLIVLTLVFAVFAVFSQSFAQNDTKKEVKTYKTTPEEQATKITDKLSGKLNLTTEQYGKIQKLFADNIAYRRDLRTKDLISKSEIKQRKEDFKNGLKSTLTEDQQKKMKKMMKKKHAKNRKHHRHGF
jgi:hypothetical protein